MSHISIIGAGSRWTSLAQVLSDNNHSTLLRSLYEKDINLINQCHINPSYLKEDKLPESISATTDLSLAIQKAEYLILSVPSHALISVVEQLQPHYNNQPIIIATKGLCPSSEFLFSSQISKLLQPSKLAVLSGPSHAEEVIKRMPTRVTIASADREFCKDVATLFSTPYFHCETSEDIVGIQIAGALKNIIALLCGMSDGLGWGVNQKSVLITKGTQEIANIIQQYSWELSTMYGISWLGDVIVTATSSQFSRNRQAGNFLAQGHSVEEIKSTIMQMVVESFFVLDTLPFLLWEKKSEYPLLSLALEIYQTSYSVAEMKECFSKMI